MTVQNKDGQRLVRELLENTESMKAELAARDEKKKNKKSTDETAVSDATSATPSDGRLFKKFKIKDIVFLAIMTACTLVTGGVMPLLTNVPLFGIIQLGLGLQFSVFPTIGMMKIRKPGALLFMSVFIGVFLVFMFAPMALIVVCAVVAEAVALLIFRGYKNDWACVVAGTLYMPLTLPLLYLYYNVFYTVQGNEKQAISMFIGGGNTPLIIAMSFAVLALCFVGSLAGMLISRELKKAGKFH